MLDFTKLKLENVSGVGTVQLDLVPGKRAYVFIGENGIGKTMLLLEVFRRYYLTMQANSSGVGTVSLPYSVVVLEQIRDRGRILDMGEGWKVLHRPDDQKDPVEDWLLDIAKSSSPFKMNSKKNKKLIESFLGCLNKIDSRYDPDFLEIDDEDSIFLKVDGKIRSLRTLSSGFTSILKIVQSILVNYSSHQLQETAGLIFIDEIESHLHVEWQVKIIPKLKELFPNTTFIIATHSPLVLSQLEDGEAYGLYRDTDDVVRARKVDHPGSQVMIDLLQNAFGIDLNRLALDRPVTDAQQKSRLELLDRLKKRA